MVYGITYMKKKIIGRLLALFLILGCSAIAYYYYYGRESTPQTSIRLFGNIDIRQVQLAFYDTGRIQRLHAYEGDYVKAGQLLAEIDPIRYEAAVARAKAEVAKQEQNLARLLAGSRPQEIAAAKARLDRTEARLRDAQKIYDRMLSIYKQDPGATSQQQVDNSRADLKASQAMVDEAKQALDLAVIGPRKEDIAAARATLEAAKASLRLSERELTDTKLYAPEMGVIEDRIMEPGDMAFPQSPVYTLALVNPVWARVYLEEPDLGKVAPGMKAEIRTDSFPDKVYPGWIGFISPTAEFTPKQVETTELRSKLVYRARVYACNPDNELRLGMPVTVTVPLDQPKKPETNEQPIRCPEK